MQSPEDLQAVPGGREVRVTNARKSGAWYRNRCRAVVESTWRVKYIEGGSRVGGGTIWWEESRGGRDRP